LRTDVDERIAAAREVAQRDRVRGSAWPTPVSIGFIAPTSIPRARKPRTSAHATTVLPTPVSVP
jgi:hypothetical protein